MSRRRPRRAVLRRGAVGALGIASGAAFLGCSPGAAVPAPAQAPPPPAAVASPVAAAAQPKRGGTFRLPASTEIVNLDVHGVAQINLVQFGPGVVYSRLLEYQAGPQRPGLRNVVTGDLAESWQQVDDLTWVFKLRPGITWQNIAPLNGREFRADDVVYSLNRQLALKVTAAYLPALEKIEAVDVNTLKLVQPKPDADFLAVLASPYNRVVAREAVDVHGDLKSGPSIGTGPWILEKWEQGVGSNFVRNPNYFRKGLPYLDRLEIPRIADEQTSRSAFRTKALQVSPNGMLRSELEALKKQDSSLVLTTYIDYSTGPELEFNVTKAPFIDKRVRQAFSKVLDRQTIIDSVFEGQGRWLVKMPLPDPDWYVPEDEVKKAYALDVAGARQLMTAAGLASGVDVELTSLNLGVTFTAPGEIFQQSLKQIGVNATIKLVDGPTWNVNVSTRGEHQLASGVSTPTNSANVELFSKYHSGGGRNPAQLHDPKLDGMIEQQAILVHDPAGRKKLLQDIQRYILDEVPYAFIRVAETTVGMWPQVKDYAIGLPSGESSAYTYTWLDQ
jgi:peptide/nickel transport system substrate-binding protein